MIRTLKARLDELESLNGTESLRQTLSPNANDCSGGDHSSQSRGFATGGIDANSTCWESSKSSYIGEETHDVENCKALNPSNATDNTATTAIQAATTTMPPTDSLDNSQNTVHHNSTGPVLNELFKPLEIVSREREPQDRLSDDFPSTILDINSSAKPKCTCDQSLDLLSCALPLRRQADNLVEIFFQRHNRMFPILHQDTFMCRYQWLWQPRSNMDMSLGYQCLGLCKQGGNLTLFLALLNVLFAIATLTSPGEPDQNIEKANAYFTKAWKTGVHELLDHDVGFEPIQVGLLMSLYLQSTEKFSKCWNVLGLTISLARNKGLSCENDADEERCFDKQYSPQLMSEMRVRLWDACIVIDT